MTNFHQIVKSRGQILKEARESQGISLDSVHDTTKIPLDVLRAIEEGYTVRTLSTFYLKGFVKMYAQYLSVDVNDVLDDYHEEKLPEPIKDETDVEKVQIKFEQIFNHHRQQQIFKFAVAIIVLVFIGRLVGCIRQYQVEKRESQKSGSPVEDKIVREKAEDTQKNDRQKAQAADKKVNETKKPSSTQMKPAAVVRTVASQDKPTPAVQPSAAGKTPVVQPQPVEPADVDVSKVNLTVKAKQRGWLQVKVDGNLVFQSVLNKGITETWQADESIEISGKNIHDLEYEVNGKILGGLGRSDRNAKRVVITRDGLAVKR